jgi:hypothetical protein
MKQKKERQNCRRKKNREKEERDEAICRNICNRVNECEEREKWRWRRRSKR